MIVWNEDIVSFLAYNLRIINIFKKCSVEKPQNKGVKGSENNGVRKKPWYFPAGGWTIPDSEGNYIFVYLATVNYF